MKPTPLEYFIGLSTEDGGVVTHAAAHNGKIYLFTRCQMYVVEKTSWLSRKWTAIKHRLQRWWDVGWEIPQ
jgi:hypothetical protein